MLDIDLIKQCAWDASKGKRNKAKIKHDLENLDSYAQKLLRILENDEFVFKHYHAMVINEGTTRKERTIVTPRFMYDQVVHHLIVSQLKPIVSKSLYEQAYGSIKGRGVHVAKKVMEKWIRGYGNKRVYVFKCDIRKFYDNIDHNILKHKLQHKINDQRYLNLVFDLIDSFSTAPGKGIPKGFYTSQWFAHFYLTGFDHYVKQEVGAEHYMRYVDDIVILSTNKRKLRKQKQMVEAYLRDELNLELKPNWQIYRFVDKNNEHGRDIDFMGFRFFRGKTTLRKRNLRSIRRKANKLDKKRKAYNNRTGKGVNAHDAQSMLSYMGWTKHADVYGYYQKWIKPKVNKRSLRKKISAKQKRENKSCPVK